MNNNQNKPVSRERTFGPLIHARENELILREKRGVHSILDRRACAVFQGIVFDYFFWNGLSKEGNFSGAGCQNMLKGKFCQIGLFFSPTSVFWRIIFANFSYSRPSFDGKILEQGKKIFSSAHPTTNLGQIPLPEGKIIQQLH